MNPLNTFVSPYVEKSRWLQNSKYQMKRVRLLFVHF